MIVKKTLAYFWYTVIMRTSFNMTASIQDALQAIDVMRQLGAPPNPARQLLESWVEQGWLVKAGQRYRMSVEFKRHYPQILDQNR